MKDGNADDPRQDRAVRLIALWSTLHDAIVGAVEDELGRHGLRDVLYQRLFETARDAAVQSQPDATAIADEIMQLEQDFGLCGNVLERAPERVVREVTKCPGQMFGPPVAESSLGGWRDTAKDAIRCTGITWSN
mgnify:CR=1 FL=1